MIDPVDDVINALNVAEEKKERFEVSVVSSLLKMQGATVKEVNQLKDKWGDLFNCDTFNSQWSKLSFDVYATRVFDFNFWQLYLNEKITEFIKEMCKFGMWQESKNVAVVFQVGGVGKQVMSTFRPSGSHLAVVRDGITAYASQFGQFFFEQYKE